MPEPRYLTTAELAKEYAVPNRDCVDCWQRLLKHWRLEKKLRNGRDIAQKKIGRCHVRTYNEVSVLILLWNKEGHLFAEAVKAAYSVEIPRIVRASEPNLPNEPK